ncbi:MAG: hypothetical protein L3J69_10850 [Desulfobacula sp.]|nr:hypothetical protein [Desulfobacula sp.]
MAYSSVFCRELVKKKNRYAFLPGAIICILVTLLTCMQAHAGMQVMDDGELAGITASGFSKFTLTQGVTDIARIDLNLTAATYTQVGVMKMGYWDNGSGQGWDQDWQSLSFGSNLSDLVLKNFVLEARFNNISDPGNRQLQSITMGFTDVTGTISTDFGTFSGSIQGVNYNRALLGFRTVTLANEPFLLTLEITNGVSFKIGW